MTDRDSFIKKVKKVDKPRVHSILNSYGIEDGYKYYKTVKPDDEIYSLTLQQYSSIIKAFNNKIKSAISLGNRFVFPCRLGAIELRKRPTKVYLNEDKIKSNHPVDWDRTLKFWYEDEEAYNNRTVIRVEERNVFKIYYSKSTSDFINQAFYGFKVNRDLKMQLKKNIKDNKGAAFLMH